MGPNLKNLAHSSHSMPKKSGKIVFMYFKKYHNNLSFSSHLFGQFKCRVLYMIDDEYMHNLKVRPKGIETKIFWF